VNVLTILLIILATVAAGAQSTNQSQIRHIETSLNHLTVLEFGESVTTLAVADPDSFEIERHDDKIFIKPLRDGVSTNLFVWTQSRELSYELDPAGQVAQMDVLLRVEPVRSAPPGAEVSVEPSDAEIHKIASLVLTQAMMGVEVILHDPEKQSKDRVRVDLEQVYRAKDRIYIRYSVANQSDAPFRITTPHVSIVVPTAQPIALLSLRNHQISTHAFKAFRAKQTSDVQLIEAETTMHDLAPGETATDVVSIGLSTGQAPRIYQFNFGADQSGPLRVEAVL
jgi:hypothetical protein